MLLLLSWVWWWNRHFWHPSFEHGHLGVVGSSYSEGTSSCCQWSEHCISWILVILCSFEIVLTPSWENCYCYSAVVYYCWTSPVSYNRSLCPGKISWCHEIALFLVIIGGIQNFILKKVTFLSWWWQGLSVAVVEDSLLAFGGYNGHFNNQVCSFCSFFWVFCVFLQVGDQGCVMRRALSEWWLCCRFMYFEHFLQRRYNQRFWSLQLQQLQLCLQPQQLRLLLWWMANHHHPLQIHKRQWWS